jgi:hypothetical protein
MIYIRRVETVIGEFQPTVPRQEGRRAASSSRDNPHAVTKASSNAT